MGADMDKYEAPRSTILNTGEILAATLTVTADSQSREYGDVNPELTYQYSGWKNGETEGVLSVTPTITTTVDQNTDAGTYTNSITVSGGSATNYNLKYVAGTFTVTKAMLLVAADAQNKIFGTPNPVLTYTYSGWKNGDDESVLDTSPVATTTVTQTTSPGIYADAITVSGGVDNNYDFTYMSSDFTVTNGTVIAWLDAQTKAYGQPNPVLTYHYTGFAAGDDESVLDVKPFPETTVGQYSEAGYYPGAIYMVGGMDDKYLIFNIPASFTVTKVKQQIAFGELASVTYGDGDFTLSASASSGLAVTYSSGNENVAVVSGNKLSITGAGTAVITATQPGTSNFEAATATRTLTVGKKQLTVSGLQVKDKEYDGTAVAQLSGGTLSGVVNSDTLILDVPATGTFSQTAIGTNLQVWATITLSGDKSANYQLTLPALTGNILPRVIHVTAQGVNSACQDSEQELHYTYEPSLIGDDTFTGVLSRTTGNTPGVYPINQGTLSLGSNYAIDYKGADYVILSSKNEPPVVDFVSDQKAIWNSKQFVLTLTGIDPVNNCQVQQIESIEATAENKTLIPEIQVSYAQGQTATLTIKIADKQVGETKITVKLKDNGGTSDGGNDTREISFTIKVEFATGVEELTDKTDMIVYPNPSTGPVNIRYSGFDDPYIRILTVGGKEVYSRTKLSGLLPLDLSGYSSGIYLVELSENGKIVTRKLILKK